MRSSLLFALLALLLLAALPGQAVAQYPYGLAGPQLGAPDSKPPGSFAGTIEEVTKKSIRVEFADGNGLNFYCSAKTQILDGDKKLKCADLQRGQQVTVESKHARGGTLDAVRVKVVATDPKPQLANRP